MEDILSYLGAVTGSGSVLALLYAFTRKFVLLERSTKAFDRISERLLITIDRVDTMWRTIVERAIEEGLMERGSDIKLTDKALILLIEPLKTRIDKTLHDQAPNSSDLADPATFVVSHLYDRIAGLAKDAGISLEAAIATISCYVRLNYKEASWGEHQKSTGKQSILRFLSKRK